MRRLNVLALLAMLAGTLVFTGPAAAAGQADPAPAGPDAARTVEARGLTRHLFQWWHPGRGDNVLTGTHEGDDDARFAGYTYVRHEGYALQDREAGSVPLYQFWHAGRGDNLVASSRDGILSAIAAGYTTVRIEAWVYPTQRAGTVPLILFWHPGREDNFVTATQAGIDSAAAAGYQLVRIEGYVRPAG
jgi:hypothetical protein